MIIVNNYDDYLMKTLRFEFVVIDGLLDCLSKYLNNMKIINQKNGYVKNNNNILFQYQILERK